MPGTISLLLAIRHAICAGGVLREVLLMTDRVVVAFLFAEEKLLFRYPFSNPFTIDLSSNTTTTDAAPLSPSDEMQRRQRSAGGSHETTINRPHGLSTGGVRCKPRAARRPTSTTPVAAMSSSSSRCRTDEGDDDVPRPPTNAVGCSSTVELPLGRSVAPYPNERGVSAKGCGAGGTSDGDITCVGIETAALLHLLRASFAVCTTVQFAGATFLIYPLIPNSVKWSRMSSGNSWPPHDGRMEFTCGRDVDTQHETDNARYSRFPGSSKDGEGCAVPRLTRVVLVIAMNRSDRDDGGITDFVQIFVNVLLREELRTWYVTRQLRKMEEHLRVWRACIDRDESENSKNCVTFSGVSGVPGANAAVYPPSDLEMYERLLEQDDLSLCTEVAQLVRCITAATTKRSGGNVAADSSVPTNSVGDFRAPYSAESKSGTSACGLGESRGRCGTQVGFTVRGLFSLPVELLTGHREIRRCPAFANARLHPNYIVTVEDANFVERLTKRYGEAVGRRAAQLLPLSAIRKTISALSPPLRVGTLYRALERTFAETPRSCHVKRPQQHGSYSFMAGSPTNVSVSEELNHIADCDILVVEAVEFLRSCGVLAVDTELTVVFTHCDIFPISETLYAPVDNSTKHCSPRPPQLSEGISTHPAKVGSAGTTQFISESSICIMLLEGFRQSSSLGFDGLHAAAGGRRNTPSAQLDGILVTPTSASIVKNTSPSPTGHLEVVGARERDTPLYSVYCAWGDACPLCEELAAAYYLWAVDGVPVRLIFPFLSAPIVDAANKRARQGTHSFDRDCCSLISDQAPWFTSLKPLKSGVELTDTSPHHLYRELVNGYGDDVCRGSAMPSEANVASAGQTKADERMRVRPTASGMKELNGGNSDRMTSGVSDSEATVLTPGSIPDEAKAWLAANREAIESRLNAGRRQRLLLRERLEKSREKRGNETGSASIAKGRDDGNGGGGVGSACLPPPPQQRYRKRDAATVRSVPNTLLLPLPTTALNSTKQMNQPQAQQTRTDWEVPCSSFLRSMDHENVVPVEVLMQFVLHHTIALVWGRAGINVDTLMRKLECNLRRLPLFLSGVRRQKTLTPSSTSSVEQLDETTPLCSVECTETSLLSSPGRCGEKGNEGGTRKHQDSESDLQFRNAYTVFSELLLLDSLAQCSHLTLEVVPTKLLFHAVVNAFSDILLIGRGDTI